MNRTLYENIVYGLTTSPSIDAVMALIERLNLVAPFLAKMADGLLTEVGVGGSKLSGGQRQITVLIKLFLSNPEVVLLDEPTSNLDEDIKELVMNLIVMAMKGRTVIVVTHDPLLLEYANDVLYF
jgi:ABC-type bacteriocin/lantibiotic exporter with double-glycine peptidase domain